MSRVCSVSVSEDEVVGRTLLHLTATDADHTYDNTKLEYNIISTSISSTDTDTGTGTGTDTGTGTGTGTDTDTGTGTGSTGEGRRCFKMTESTGELILVSALDRERIDRYELTVTASDRGQPSLTTTTTVSEPV